MEMPLAHVSRAKGGSVSVNPPPHLSNGLPSAPIYILGLITKESHTRLEGECPVQVQVAVIDQATASWPELNMTPNNELCPSFFSLHRPCGKLIARRKYIRLDLEVTPIQTNRVNYFPSQPTN